MSYRFTQIHLKVRTYKCMHGEKNKNGDTGMVKLVQFEHEYTSGNIMDIAKFCGVPIGLANFITNPFITCIKNLWICCE